MICSIIKILEPADWIQLCMLLVAAIAVYFSSRDTNKAIKESAKSALAQSQAQLFAEYTRRYQEIILRTPDSIYNRIAAPTDENVKRYMRLYFDLCSEEYYLHNKGVISDGVWNMWQDGMRLNMKKNIYVASWRILRGEYNKPFQDHFEKEVMIDKRNSI